MTDADILRSQIPASTDPERLEREAARAELPEGCAYNHGGHAVLPMTFKAWQPEQASIIFSTGSGAVLTITPDGKLIRGSGLSDDEASAAFIDCLSRYLPTFLHEQRQQIEQAKAHISKLTSFYMDNVLWTRASNEAVAFVKKMGSTAGAVPIDPDRPSSPATDIEGAAV